MELLSVGQVAAGLGVAPSTVRMWGQRYGLTASTRSSGGHRRYTALDVERLRQMHAAVITGVSPAAAAAGVLSGGRTSRAGARTGPGGPGGSVLAVPDAGPVARGLARAAYRLDESGVENTVLENLRTRGTLATWEDVLRPVLVASGDYWARTGQGIDIEHLLTQAVTMAFVRHVAELPKVAQDRAVLLAGGPTEEHMLPLYAIRAALAEDSVPARLLGARTPMSALASAARRTRAPGTLVWLSLPDLEAAGNLPKLRAAHRRMTLLVGGGGWDVLETGAAVRFDSLAQAVELLSHAWLGKDGGRSGGQHRFHTDLAQVADSRIPE